MDEPDGTIMTIFHDRSVLKLKSGSLVNILYDPETYLPVMNEYNDLKDSEKSLKGFKGSVIDEDNQNLTVLQKTLMKWHQKLGHLGMQHTQWLGRNNMLDGLGDKWGSTGVAIPKCRPCLIGKQSRTPKPNVKHVKSKELSTKKNILEPGDLIFSDQYESREEGLVFSYKGASLKSETFKGGTIFIDGASGYIEVHHQASFNASDTIMSKMKFERNGMGMGVHVKRYCTDNGIYTSQDFMDEIHKNEQCIRHCGVGGNHQNGVA